LEYRLQAVKRQNRLKAVLQLTTRTRAENRRGFVFPATDIEYSHMGI
jgi:hypothetical protein